jgi:hypothetical protein
MATDGSSRYPSQAKEACRRQKNASHDQFSSEQALRTGDAATA